MKHYLAGPMSGLPQYNFKQFDIACIQLRARELDIRSPHEIDHGETLETRGSKVYGDYMRAGLKMLLDCDSIILMEGWQRSKGCLTEAWVAQVCGHQMYGYSVKDDQLMLLSAELKITPVLAEYFTI